RAPRHAAPGGGVPHARGRSGEVDAEPDHGGRVAHGVDPGNGCGQGVRIADVGPMNVDAVAPCARRVEDPDAIAGGDERVDDVRPDEPCPAGDENVHLSAPGWEGEGDGEPAAALLLAHADGTPPRLA